MNSFVDEHLIVRTQEVWSEYGWEEVSRQDVIEIINNVRNFIGILQEMKVNADYKATNTENTD